MEILFCVSGIKVNFVLVGRDWVRRDVLGHSGTCFFVVVVVGRRLGEAVVISHLGP